MVANPTSGRRRFALLFPRHAALRIPLRTLRLHLRRARPLFFREGPLPQVRGQGEEAAVSLREPHRWRKQLCVQLVRTLVGRLRRMPRRELLELSLIGSTRRARRSLLAPTSSPLALEDPHALTHLAPIRRRCVDAAKTTQPARSSRRAARRSSVSRSSNASPAGPLRLRPARHRPPRT